MKGGELPSDTTESFLTKFYVVLVFPNGAEVWTRYGDLYKVVYNTGDEVYFKYDPETDTDRADIVVTHDGWTNAV